EQVEERFQEASGEHPPLAPVDDVVAHHDQARAEKPRQWARRGRGALGDGGHVSSLARSERRARAQPTTVSTVRTSRLTAAVDPTTVSRHSIRTRLTPCHRGVHFATNSPTVPRLEIGKNAPENRKRGTRPSR